MVTNGWMVQTTTLCVNLAFYKDNYYTFFHSQLEFSLSPQSFLCHYESQNSKLFNSSLAIFDKNVSHCFYYKIFCQIKTFLFSILSLIPKTLCRIKISPPLFPILSLVLVVKISKPFFLINKVVACKFHSSRWKL